MKSYSLLFMTVMATSMVLAQGRAAADGGRKEPDQYAHLQELTSISNENEYTQSIPQIADDVKTKIKHKDNYRKGTDVKGWHYFDISYKVGSRGTNNTGKEVPILSIPEVEITYALLYDMATSKAAMATSKKMNATTPALGWADLKQRYVLLTDTKTYTNITPDREHYAAVCVPPSFIYGHGKPIIFSVELKINGVRQGNIMTSASNALKIDGKDASSLLVEKGRDGKAVPSAWWERIQNLTQSVDKMEYILKDRSETAFGLVGDLYYDALKAAK